ncbi:MAG: hypothetical protein ACP5HV_01535 [Thermoplasmata archaeon]
MQYPIQLPHTLTSMLSYLYQNSTITGIVLIFISLILVIFSRYFKWIFLISFIIIEIYLYATLNSYFIDKRIVLAGILSSLIFMPFFYLALKNGYSITVINLILIGYLLIFLPLIIISSLYIAVAIIVFFIISLLTFTLFVRLKRRIYMIRGEEV